jgi:glycosyltransferase involved in cell wall biosynthesis
MTTRRALVVAPTPSHPADHGHRNRVRQTTSLLAATGHAIDFVLYPMDDDWRAAIPPGLAQMQAAWGGRRDGTVSVVPPTRELHAAPLGTDHTLDEWWDPALDAQISFLCARRAHDVMLVNYIFLSRAFLHAPPRCRRVLDTHDRLSGRRLLFEANGAPPEFFFTTEAEEARGLNRADIVLAIKPSETDSFRAMTAREVMLLPFGPGRRANRARAIPAGDRTGASPLRIGFLGADNSVNAINLAAFLRRLAVWRALYLPNLHVVVAGNVCRRVAPAPPFVTLLGHLADTDAFYDAIDVVVAPMAFSTGLKIKVAEAIGRGIPVVATADAFDGFTPADLFHALPDIDAVCAALMALAADPARLAVLARATRKAAAAARDAATRGAAELRAALHRPRRTMRVVTDLDYRARSTLAEERCWQAVNYFSALLDIRVVSPPAAGTSPAEDIIASWTEPRGDSHAGLPPLRHLPPNLRWGDAPAASPSALAIVERSDIPEESAAREALLRALLAACAGHRLAVLWAADLPRDPTFLATLATLPKPCVIVGIDLDAEPRGLAACLAGLAGLPFFGLGDPYPLMSECGVVRNPREHVASVASWLISPSPSRATCATADAGWSRLWARLAAADAYRPIDPT